MFLIASVDAVKLVTLKDHINSHAAARVMYGSVAGTKKKNVIIRSWRMQKKKTNWRRLMNVMMRQSSRKQDGERV